MAAITEKQRRILMTEARARVFWGESPLDIRAWLAVQGVNDRDADQLLRDCLSERAREMRALGMRDLFMGVPALVAAFAIFIGGVLAINWLEAEGHRVSRNAYVMIMFVAIPLGVFGSHRSWRGFDRVVFGSKADGAVM